MLFGRELLYANKKFYFSGTIYVSAAIQIITYIQPPNKKTGFHLCLWPWKMFRDEKELSHEPK